MGTLPRSGSIKRLLCALVAGGLATLPLTGCWDRLELEERAVVLGISVDVAEESGAEQEDEVSHSKAEFAVPGKDMIRVAVQIALPGRIPLGPGEGGGGGKSGGAETVWVISVVGHSIDDALMNLQQQLSGRLFFGHLRVIVVSEEIARKGLQNINDYLHRNSEVRRMAWMMIAKGNAENLMKVAPELERVPTLYLLSTMDNAVKLGKFPENYVGMFWSNMVKLGQEAFLPYVEMKKDQNVEVKGLAYFRDGKMVGATQPFDIAAYMVIKGINPAGYRGYVRLGDPDRTVTIYATSRRSTWQVRIQDGVPHFRVYIFSEINLEEKLNEELIVNHSDVLKEIQLQNRNSLTETCMRVIQKTQQARSDIFGFGEYVRAKLPGFWAREVKTKQRWQEMYPHISVEVVINTKLRRIGMKAK